MKNLLPIFLILFFSTGCSDLNLTIVEHDSEIDSKLMVTINELDMKIFSMIKLNDYTSLEPMLTSTTAKQYGSQLKNELLPKFAGLLAGTSYSIFDDFHVKRLVAGTSMPIHADKISAPSYTFIMPGTASEVYASVLELNGPKMSYLLTMIFVKEHGWKLSELWIGGYKINGKTWKELEGEAIELEQQGDILDAYAVTNMAVSCSNPCNQRLLFDSTARLEQYHRKIKAAFDKKYPLPYTLPGIASNPEMADFLTDFKDKTIYVALRYKSQIPLEDTVALKKENDLIQKNIEKIFPGITAHNDVIVYMAYNDKIPKPQQHHGYYNFIFRKNAMSTN